MVLLSLLLLGLIGSALSHTESHCWDKKADPKGFKYRGHVNTTKTGLVCQRWDAQWPNSHKVTPQKYPKAGLDDNYCRNADGEPGPWCYNSKGTKPRWELCAVPECPDWTPFFNSTTKHYDVGKFHVDFAQKKRVDKGLYIAEAVNLYDENGSRLGAASLILYIRPNKANKMKTVFTGWKRFTVGNYVNPDKVNPKKVHYGYPGKCGMQITLPYLHDANFEMITDVRSKEMFKFKLPGAGGEHVEDMGWCRDWGKWKEVVEKASTMKMRLRTNRYIKDLPDYFTTAYKVTKN